MVGAVQTAVARGPNRSPRLCLRDGEARIVGLPQTLRLYRVMLGSVNSLLPSEEDERV
jgi:hypothetical protein